MQRIETNDLEQQLIPYFIQSPITESTTKKYPKIDLIRNIFRIPVTEAGVTIPRELQQDQSRGIQIIEELTISLVARINLLLVYTGVKPLTSSTIKYMYKIDPHSYMKSGWNLGHLEEERNIGLISRIAIPFEIIDDSKPEQENVLLTLCASWDKDKIERFKSADFRELGRLYGFPETAIEAFIGEKEILRKDQKHLPDLENMMASAFSWFIMSQDNWQEELKTGELWANTVRETSPKLYQEFMTHYRKTRNKQFPSELLRNKYPKKVKYQ